MDSEVKKQIKSLVLSLRNLIEDDLAVVLKRYGIFTDRAWLPVDKIPKADDEILHTRQRLEAAMQPNLERGVKRPEAARLYVREAGFTYLNRLVGLKVLEVRDLFPETIQTRPEYGGRSLYQRDFRAAHPELANAADDALPAALEAACRDVSQQIRFVFDVESESSILWPRYAALKEAIQRINALPVEVWQEDEIIGWIYQFYNAEEKKAIRKRGKPKLPIEVAVINQFFTPRWIVKYLVDNTLGRLWLEMHPDSQGVRAKCDYLVPEPLGVPENGGEEGKIQLDPDSPVNNPDAAPRREPKHPQGIRLIDPACGTMHFGHYAFEVFQEIYRDAREQGWVDAEDALEDRDIPLSILKHNLYGVDIDLRAVQLAALSLYVKARTSQRAAGMADDEAARLPWSVNLVCADARLTDGGMRERFLSAYADDPVLVRAWKELFREMEDIGQVGSLLRVEERFRQILRDYKPPTVAGLQQPHQESLPGVPIPPRQMSFGETPGSNGWNASRTLQTMFGELRGYAYKALVEQDVNAQIFATEAEKTIGLLDTILQNYDIVVMNPPYGYSTSQVGEYLKEIYPSSNNNLLCMFVDRSINDLAPSGYIGALLDETFLLKSTYERFRREILLSNSSLVSYADLGWGVLDDAQVEVAALVQKGSRNNNNDFFPTTFFRLSSESDQPTSLTEELIALRNSRISSRDITYILYSEDFKIFPNAAMAFWAPKSIRVSFSKFPSLDPTFGITRKGVSPGDANRFYRFIWEVNKNEIGSKNKWALLANGGSYSPFYRGTDQVIYFAENGKALDDFSGAYVRSKDLYFKSGITWGKRTNILNMQKLEVNHVFTDEGHGLFPNKDIDTWWLMAILNSKFIQTTINMICGLHKHPGYVGALPIAYPEKETLDKLTSWAEFIFQLKNRWDIGNELSMMYKRPWLLLAINREIIFNESAFIFEDKTIELPEFIKEQKYGEVNITSEHLTKIIDQLENLELLTNKILSDIQNEIDSLVYKIYETNFTDRVMIEKETSNRPPDFVLPQMASKSEQEKRREHVRRLLSFFLLQSIQEDREGILALTLTGEKPTVMDVIRDKMEKELGEQRAFQYERDIAQELGKTIKNWLDSDFIQWHTKLYQKCPVIWHLASPKGNFACLIYYHKLKQDTLLSVRTVYLWRLRDSLRAKLKAALEKKDYIEINKLEEALTDIEEFDQALAKVIDAGWDPDIDAGVKANILPLQEAGLLRYKVI